MKRKLLLILYLVLFSCLGFAQKHTPDHYDYAIRQAFKEGRWDAGKYMLDEAEPYYGKLSVFYELKGWYFYHNKNYIEARYNLSNSLQEDNSNTNARTILSKVEEETGHYSAAICYINELLQKNPYNKSLWIRKINMYKKLGNTTEADKLVKRLSEIYPNDEDVKNLFEEEYNAKLKGSREKGDIRTQLSVAKDLVSVNPTAENYLSYTNALLGAGYLSEALNISAEGAAKTKSSQLIKKHCDILCEQGKYTEAINYISNNFGNNAGALKLKESIEMEQVRNAAQYDPYTMNQKLYYKTHDNDAFNYIVNTGLSRGYYYDVLDAVKEYKKTHKTVSTDVLYKEYTAYYRLGNTEKASEILEKIAEQDKQASINEELCDAYYKQGNELISTGDYEKACQKFEYVVNNGMDTSLVNSSREKLYTCYLETNKLDEALKVVDSDDYTRKAVVYQKKGEYKNALSCALNSDTTLYKEISIEYIKKLIDAKEYKQAYTQCGEALSIVDAPELYMYAISSGTKINKDVSPYIITGIEKYPKDDYFINQYCGLMNTEAMALYKEKSYDEALEKVNAGLEYNENDKELTNTKGLIYEKMKQYELSYEYQKSYTPGILDAYEFRKKMQGMKSKGYNNEIDVYYQYRRNEDDDVHKSLAGLSYSRVIKKHTIMPFLNYCARNGDRMTAIQIGGTYDYLFRHDIDLGLTFAYGTNYLLPRYDAKISLTAGLPKDWSVFGHFEYKRIDIVDSIEITSKDIYNVGLGFSKGIEHVSLTYKADLFVITKNVYFNMMGRCDYMPLDGNKTKLFISAGFGTAPEVSITDNILPGSIKKLNTFVGGGANYWFNEHIGLGLDGSWYTLYESESAIKYTNLFYITVNSFIRF